MSLNTPLKHTVLPHDRLPTVILGSGLHGLPWPITAFVVASNTVTMCTSGRLSGSCALRHAYSDVPVPPDRMAEAKGAFATFLRLSGQCVPVAHGAGAAQAALRQKLKFLHGSPFLHRRRASAQSETVTCA
jgi:hypothetical protein